ncbi:MAG: hypothetical protein RB191_24910 [Terriglobia bacterium]|nr:hypothetical protein [Terriglobia bacterium]
MKKPRTSKSAVVRCHREGCKEPGVVVVEAPCCGKTVLVCVPCAWEAFQHPDCSAGEYAESSFGVYQ